MITVIVKDDVHDSREEDVEILRLEFPSKEEAEEKMHHVMDNLSAQFGSGSREFYWYFDEDS